MEIVVSKMEEGCPRCLGDHEGLRFVPLAHSVNCDHGYSYWSSCPTTEEPILLAFSRDPFTHEEVIRCD